MTVAALTSTKNYIEDGVTLTFALPFRFTANSIVASRVLASGAVVALVLGVDFSTTGGTTDAGGSATLASSVAGSRLRFKRVTARAQTTDYTTGDRFPAETHELTVDRAMLIDQEQDDKIDDTASRAILVPDGETGSTLAARSLRLGGGKVLAPNSVSGAIEVQSIDSSYRGPTGPANSTFANRGTMASTAPTTNLSALVVGDGLFTWRAGDYSALIAALPADFIASTFPSAPLGAWIRTGEGIHSLAAMALGTYTLGQVVTSLIYGGSTWIVRANPIVLQNDFVAAPLDSSKIDFSDQFDVVVNLVGGGTAILECQLGSIAGYIRQLYSENYAKAFARATAKAVIGTGAGVIQGPPVTAYCYGTSITYGQFAAGGPIATGFGDGSQHVWTKIGAPFPETLITLGSGIFGANKFAAVNKGYSGDRIGNAYRRHRFQGNYTVPSFVFMEYGTNDCLYATDNGKQREGLFTATIAGTSNENSEYLFDKFVPAYRKFLFREVLRGGVPICLAPYVFSSVAAEQDGTTWNAGKIAANFRAAIRMAADEIGALSIDLADVVNLYPNAQVTHDGTHLNNTGAYIVAAAAIAPLIGAGWRSAIVVRENTQLLALTHLHNMNGLGSAAAFDLAFTPNAGSLGQAFGATTDGADLLLDTNSVYFSVYLDDDEIDFMPVMTLANTVAVQWQADLGRTAPRSRLNTVRAGSGLPALTATNASIANSTGSTKSYNHASSSGVAAHATLRGRGFHTIILTPVAGQSVIHGIQFGRFNKAAAIIADPAGGATVDAQARTAVTAILNALRDQGLLKV